MPNATPKIVVILGPTASGKSDLAIHLARKFNGEIISADSRQVYRGMDIGTGKVPGAWSMKHGAFISEKIPHYLIDIVSPRTDYNVAKFKKGAEKAIDNILQRGKLPIICGGTGFWIATVVDNISFPEVKPDLNLRRYLHTKSTVELFRILNKLDSIRATNIDRNNPARLIRAIEIAKSLGKVPPHKPQTPKYESLQIGISLPKIQLQKNIRLRLQKRLRQGMVAEVRKLHQGGVNWKRLEAFGLEYRWIARFLQEKIFRREMEENLYFDIIHYAKRQMTWFHRDKRIHWMHDRKKTEIAVKKFIK